MQFEYVMQFVVLAGGGVDDFVAIVELRRIRDEVEVRDVDANGFFSSRNIMPSLSCSVTSFAQ